MNEGEKQYIDQRTSGAANEPLQAELSGVGPGKVFILVNYEED